MPRAEGYRAGRLRRRRERKVQRWQVAFLVALAAVVAFAAVVGAFRLADFILGGEEEQRKDGYLALITFGEGEEDGRPSAVLALRDASDGSLTLYTVPRDLLLEGPGGEYVLAGDMLASGQLEGDLERLLGAQIDFTYRLDAGDLEKLAARDEVWVTLDKPVTLEVAGTERTYKGRVAIPTDADRRPPRGEGGHRRRRVRHAGRAGPRRARLRRAAAGGRARAPDRRASSPEPKAASAPTCARCSARRQTGARRSSACLRPAGRLSGSSPTFRTPPASWPRSPAGRRASPPM